MRSIPISLTSERPFAIFIELAPWAETVGTDLENHFFSRRKDQFWNYFSQYDVGALFDSEEELILTAADDEEVHEVAQLDFVFYTNDPLDKATTVTKEELNYGRAQLKKIIESSKPEVLVFVGTDAFKHFFSWRGKYNFGLQKKGFYYNNGDQRKDAAVYLLPSSMSSNFGLQKTDVEKHWATLQKCIEHLKITRKRDI